MQVRDLVAVGQRDGVTRSRGVGQPRHWPRAARRFDAEQLLPILQLDAAVERRHGVQGCQHHDRGACRRASFHVGERPERTALCPDAVTGSAGTDEPSRLIGIAAALDCGLRTGRRRPEERKDSHRAEQDSSSHRMRGNGSGILRSACAEVNASAFLTRVP